MCVILSLYFAETHPNSKKAQPGLVAGGSLQLWSTNGDSSLTNDDSSLKNDDSSLKNHDSPLKNDDSSLKNDDSPLKKPDFIAEWRFFIDE